ncbi:MAG TPA: hypothetical protein VN524_13365, partial [Hyphomicrobiaceae bacterium]|nr:hypothetical protein [Hyphomicrobiaceae bacterium]
EGLRPVFDALGEVFGLMGEMLGSLLGDWVGSWQKIGDTTEEEGKQASAVAQEIARWLREDLTPAIKNFADWWREHWDQIKTVITVAAEVLATPFKAIMAMTQALIDLWGLVLPAVKDALEPVFTYLGEWKDRLLPQVGAVWTGIITAGQKFFNDMVTNITTGLAKWVEPFRVGLENLTNLFGGWFGKTQTAATTEMGAIGTAASTEFSKEFGDGVQSGLDNVYGHSIMEDWLLKTMAEVPQRMADLGQAMADGWGGSMEDGIGNTYFPHIDDMIDSFFGNAVTQQAKFNSMVAEGNKALAAELARTTEILMGGGAAYPGGGLSPSNLPPSAAGAEGGGSPAEGSGGGKTGGPGNSTERNQFGFKEWVSGEGSAYPGSSLSAWGQNVKPFKLSEIYANAFAGMAPGLAQPKTSSITSRVVGAQTPGPTGTSGPSYAPDAAMIARYGGLVNATIAMALAAGTKTPEQAAAEYARNRQYEAVTGNVIGSGGGGYGPGQAAYEAEIRRAAQQEADARARREAAAFVLNVTNNGVSPDEVTQAITDNLNRLIWQAGME